ncbi:tetratricopeptide repeat protein [candidate division KSB3 bacterium]|uniref:Tetratricopeptide repeat protein n=1 Tax=candidate division KSB3 bacterium TaxID=2044937 RepID=A0A9D5JYS7_9BACT|nr:tetratricopeptide repeat protein [candidate division KSB3 bacterium]
MSRRSVKGIMSRSSNTKSCGVSCIPAKPLTPFFVTSLKKTGMSQENVIMADAAEGEIVSSYHSKRTLFQGITRTLTRRKIHKYQRKLGNGDDVELHLTMGDLYHHLGETAFASASYRMAAQTLLQGKKPLNTGHSDQLIQIYKRLLALNPFDHEIATQLAQEYHRRGYAYKAVFLHTSQAEHHTWKGDYQKAIAHYQQVFAIEPASITNRITCARLHCHLGEYANAAQEYVQVGDIYFEHQKFDGALEYYQQAADLDPDNADVKQKVQTTQQILAGNPIPQAQASLQKLHTISQERSDLKRSLAEKERVEKELRENIRLLRQRYQRSVARKNKQLRATRHRLEDLSTYVAVFKDQLEQIAYDKQQIQAQLDEELAHKRHLEHKLTTLHAADSQPPHGTSQSEEARRVTAAMQRLHHEKTKLEQQLQAKLQESSTRETQLRHSLADQSDKGTKLEHQLAILVQEHARIEQQLQSQLHQSLEREQILRQHVQYLMTQHEQVLQQVEQEKVAFQEKYQATQTRMNRSEARTMVTLEHLHGELTQQCEMEAHFSARFHDAVQEISKLLYDQEQQIQALERL